MHINRNIIKKCLCTVFSPGCACNYFQFIVFADMTPTNKFGHERGRYRRNCTGKFCISATWIQWKMSRTRVRPKMQKTKFKLYFIGPSNFNPGFSAEVFHPLVSECERGMWARMQNRQSAGGLHCQSCILCETRVPVKQKKIGNICVYNYKL